MPVHPPPLPLPSPPSLPSPPFSPPHARPTSKALGFRWKVLRAWVVVGGLLGLLKLQALTPPPLSPGLC